METHDIEQRISQLISQMTLEEKVALCHGDTLFSSGGVERLGIPSLKMTDGSHGIREEKQAHSWESAGLKDDASTYFASFIALAATWNKNIAEEFGTAIGEETRARGKDVLLAPGINVIRTPICGRNFEYLSEDPYLISQIAVPYIKGIQAQDVAACVKHFFANNQEQNRGTVNVEMDDRALNEIYLYGFKAAVQEGKAYTVMSAYNKFRGQYCSNNRYLLNEVLKGEWGFDGVVISDWMAVHDTVETANNGMDIEMGPRGHNPEEFHLSYRLVEAVKSGLVDESIIDDKARRILRLRYKLRTFDENRSNGSFNTPEHQQLSRKIGQEAIVLLKNDTNILPLDENSIKSIAVIGDNAEKLHARGGGCTELKALYEIPPLQGLKNRLGDKVNINYARGYAPEMDDTLIDEAVKVAANSDIAIIFSGLNHDIDTETRDRVNMKLPYGQLELIQAVYNVNPKTIVVLISGSPLEMEPWIQYVPSALQAWYIGMEGGNAIADIIFGDVSPSGKLPVTFPKRLEDSPAHNIGEYPGTDTVNYKEGIFIGYRHFDTNGVEPLFCFGHGLSYTEFKYDDLKISPQGENIEVSFSITNLGVRQGAEVAQLYLRDVECSVPRPLKELKGFEKVSLNVGEKRTVSITLSKASLAYYDEEKKDWTVESGVFEVLIGSSSRDIRLKGSFEIK